MESYGIMKNQIKIVDVTLRDGGFTCDFDWPMHFAQEYYNLMSRLDVDYIEMGYWKQTSKSSNRFFNLNLDTIHEVTNGANRNNVAVMIDFHYCNKDLNVYPTADQSEVKLIRMTARKDMIEDAVKFAKDLKKHTGLEIAFNLFNTTNYTGTELDNALDIVLDSDFDIIGFADTHGHLNLTHEIGWYEERFHKIKEAGKQTCFHLHNHTGKAYMNYIRCVESPYIDMCDSSVGSLGKGAGNLATEHILNEHESMWVNAFINRYYDSLFVKTVHPYFLITGRYGITDHYAVQAQKLNLEMHKFIKFCATVKGLYRDNFDAKLLGDYLE